MQTLVTQNGTEIVTSCQLFSCYTSQTDGLTVYRLTASLTLGQVEKENIYGLVSQFLRLQTTELANLSQA